METFWVNSGEAKLFCRSMGAGAPVLLIHGACTDSDFFLDTAKILAHFFRVFLYDRRGCGRSECPETANYSVQRQAEDAAEIIQTIGEPCHIIAHSAGTTIAMELAKSHSKFVHQLILHEPIDGDSIAPGSDEESCLEEIAALIHRGKYNSAMNRFLPRLGVRDGRAREATDGELARVGKNSRCFIRYEFERMYRYACNADLLKDFSITIGIGEGSHDTARWENAVKLAKKLNASILYYPGAHNCPFDLPREFAYLCAGILNEQ